MPTLDDMLRDLAERMIARIPDEGARERARVARGAVSFDRPTSRLSSQSSW